MKGKEIRVSMDEHPVTRGRGRRIPDGAALCFLAWVFLLLPGCSGDGTTTLQETDLEALLLAPSLGAVGSSIVFNASKSGPGVASYRFDFGDGVHVDSATGFAFHAYAVSGHFQVAVEVQIAQGKTGRAERTIRILPEGQTDFLFDIPSGDDTPPLWEVPYPNDLYLSSDGHVLVSVEDLSKEMGGLGPKVFSQAVGSLDGFGLTTAVYLPLAHPPQTGSLPQSPEAASEPGSSVCLIDIDKASDEFGRRYPLEFFYDSANRRLAVLPAAGYPLRPHTRYAVLLTTSLLSESGPYVPPEDFLALRDGHAGSQRASDLYAPLWEYMAGTVDLAEKSVVVMATVFTTQDTPQDLVRIRNYLEDVTPGNFDFAAPGKSRIYDTPAELNGLFGIPQEDKPGRDNPGGIAHPYIGTVAIGTYEDIDFRDPVSGTFQFDESGLPIHQKEAVIPVVIVLPNAPPPAQGYPVAVVQHGIGDSMAYVTTVANDLAQIGLVSVGIDAVDHGARMPLAADDENNFTAATGPDGFADNTTFSSLASKVLFFEGFLNLPGVRENFRQTVVDQMQLINILKDPNLDLSGIGSPKLDTNRLFYLSDSLGSIIGTQMIAVQPGIRAAFLNVNGGGLLNDLLINSPDVFGPVEQVLRVLFGIPEDDHIDKFSLSVNLGQSCIDGGDSMTYGQWILRDPEAAGRGTVPPPDVLMTEVIGDESVPNQAGEPLAVSIGLALLSPFLNPVKGLDIAPTPAFRNTGTPIAPVTAALVQYSPACHGADLNDQWGTKAFYPGFPFPFGPEGSRFPRLPEPLRIEQPIEQVRAQLRHFFQTNLEMGNGEIVSTQTPVADG